jgi:hypothetical protein
MTFSEGKWTLTHEKPDFSPLNFSQRFTAGFTDDGNTIYGTWESSADGARWQRDFGLTYTRST